MNFSECLKYYMQELGCSSKRLAKASGLSEATLSRYRKGDRIPTPDSEQFQLLVTGLARLAVEKGRSDITEVSLTTRFGDCFSQPQEDDNTLSKNFDQLIESLKINVSLMAKALNFDPSFLSRVKAGQRKPSDIDDFSIKTATYVIEHYKRDTDKQILAILLECSVSEIEDQDHAIMLLCKWLKDSSEKKADSTEHFLRHLDSFDLDEYIEVIHFNDIKVPNMPVQLIGSKTYYGVEEMRNAELDFLKATVFSKSTEPVFMYSNMDMEEMAKDPEFPKKFMFGLAVVLKKGLNINIIHHLDRPFNELMLGLEGWIPLYMTGQVKPYYMPETQVSVFQNLIYVSGQAALAGECIKGHHNDGKYELFKNKQAVRYYRKRSNDILGTASHLMMVYKAEQQMEYYSFIQHENIIARLKRNIISSLPVYTMSEALLISILDKNKVSEKMKDQILAYRKYQLAIVEEAMKSGDWEDELLYVAANEENQVHRLNLTHFLVEMEITYTDEDYKLHYEQHKAFDEAHSRYHCTYNAGVGFKNIDICIDKGNMVVISKRNAPVINFVITHPALVNAITNYKAPIVDPGSTKEEKADE